MIIPSIDLMNGRAVQLRRGREFVLDGGDPMERLEEFALLGEVAVVDLDAALGRGSNTALIREMVRRAPVRVGGGVRTVGAALDWLDAGATRVVIGTAASSDFCGQLPRDRVVVAVDAERGRVVVEGWQTATEHGPVERIRELSAVAGGFLLTQVEVEGGMAGFDREVVERAAIACAEGNARLTAAGGITRPDEIGWLDRLGVDAQVGMALYTGRLSLEAALTAVLGPPVDGRLWPTVVCDDLGETLGLVWSSRESLAAAIQERRGVYWSRSRNALWRKGDTSGARQALRRIELDCDRDALRFTVRQDGPGFCHTGTRSCWGDHFSLGTLERALAARAGDPDPVSGTTRLLTDPALLAAKLGEEAGELAAAATPGEVSHEAADLLYFAFVAMARGGTTLEDVVTELGRRHQRTRRRPMAAKPVAGGSNA
jgi:phosphoribosyl-ATP pyrophosphohydrolase